MQGQSIAAQHRVALALDTFVNQAKVAAVEHQKRRIRVGQRSEAADQPEAVRELAGEVRESAERAGELTGKLLAMSRRRPPAPPRAVDLAEVRGQALARRALEVAAAGAHHVLMMGPPGCGKSMLARRLSTILPPMGFEEALECARVHSAAGLDVVQLALTDPPSSDETVYMTGGAAAGDYDGDGWVDLYVTRLDAPFPSLTNR